MMMFSDASNSFPEVYSSSLNSVWLETESTLTPETETTSKARQVGRPLPAHC